MMSHAGYLHLPIREPKLLVSRVKELPEQIGGFDAVVGCGMSGAMAASIVGCDLGLRFCVVRKKSDINTHSCTRFEGNMQKGDRWIFLDDLIDSGDTFRFVYDMMKSQTVGNYKFVGAYLYTNVIALRADDDFLTRRM